MFSTLKNFCNYLIRKRSLSETKSLVTKLDRCLSTYQLIFYGIAHMIGAGIYVLTGHIIKDRTGPATNLSFLLSGLISIFTGLCYCEFATLIPKAGSCYTYTYLMLGELPAFIIGWSMIMDLIIGLSSITKGFSGALNMLCNDAIRNFTDKYVPLTRDSAVWESSADLIAALLLIILFLITLTGANISMNINVFISSLQVCFLTVIIISCFIFGSRDNYLADGGYLPFGYSSIFQGAAIAIFAYGGFESLANSAEETKDPKKSIPIALFTSLGGVVVLYVLASTGLSYMVPRLQIDDKAPFIAAFTKRNMYGLKWITGIATLLATGASKLTSIYVVPRMIYAMAEDGLIFKFLGKVDRRTKVPIVGLVVGLFFSMILSMFIKIQVLADITTMGIILSFVVIGIDLIIFRYLYDEETNWKTDSQTMTMRIQPHRIFTQRNVFIIIFICLIFSIILMGLALHFTYKISDNTGIVCSAISISLVFILTIILSFYKPSSTKEAFETPLMPLSPIISIIMNICLLINLPEGTWLRFVIGIAFGLLIYIFYGIRHSNLSQRIDEYTELTATNESNLNEKTLQ